MTHPLDKFIATFIATADGTKYWYRNGKLHRDDGPAIEYTNDEKHWYRDGKLHRDDGPAYEAANGTKAWFREGKCHRDDGPAIERADGRKEWYRDGKQLTEAEFTARRPAQPSTKSKRPTP